MDHPDASPDFPFFRRIVLETKVQAALGASLAVVAGMLAIKAVPGPWPVVWLALQLFGYGALGFFESRKPSLSFCVLIVVVLTWGLGVIALVATGAALTWGALLAAVLALAMPAITGPYKGLAAHAQLTGEQQARAEAEVAFLQAVDEIRRLRLDAQNTHEIRQQLSSTLESTNGELSVARSKAESLAGVLQRVMPFETETGLLNRERFLQVLKREWARMQRQEAPLTLVVVALDAFDKFEETYGRITYEAAIRRIAEVFRKSGGRPGDVAARLDRNRFVLMFPESDQKYGPQLAERVRTRLQQLGLANANAPDKFLSASFGLATMIPASGFADSILLERAEAALYEAQFQGGNRSVRFRTLHHLKVERWDPNREGSLTLDGMQHKLAIAGYRGQTKQFLPGETIGARKTALDIVNAVVAGELKITLDGESRVLRAGDCAFIPRGQVTSVEVLSKTRVVCIEASRA
ncbi:MAG: diguanylate cyclase [Gammaproteobacteria bacterium]|nr:diguanylate cyclase [Gammaproteobacteria bacterium]